VVESHDSGQQEAFLFPGSSNTVRENQDSTYQVATFAGTKDTKKRAQQITVSEYTTLPLFWTSNVVPDPRAVDVDDDNA
jgi:hypothetical protein